MTLTKLTLSAALTLLPAAQALAAPPVPSSVPLNDRRVWIAPSSDTDHS